MSTKKNKGNRQNHPHRVMWDEAMDTQFRALRSNGVPLVECAEIIGVCYAVARQRAARLDISQRMNRGNIKGVLLALFLLLVTGSASFASSIGIGPLSTFPINSSTNAVSVWNNSSAINSQAQLLPQNVVPQSGGGNLATANGAPAVVIQLNQTSTLNAGAASLEITYDGTNWVSPLAWQVLTGTANGWAQALSSVYSFQANTNYTVALLMGGAQSARLRLSTVITGSGSVTVYSTIVPYNVLQGLDSTGTSSPFGQTFPVIGTAIGAKNGSNMVSVTADNAGNMNTNCEAGCGLTDNTAFSAGAGLGYPLGGVYNDAVANATSGDFAVARLTATRALHVAQDAALSASATLQNAAATNGNGATLPTLGESSAALTVNCSSCSGGTTVNFEGTEDGTDYAPLNAVQLGSATIATSTTAAGFTYWQLGTAGLQNIRARISAYSAGTVTVTGHTVPVPGQPLLAASVAQSGTWTVQPGNTANTTAWLVTGTGGTFPATESGTWNVGLSTGANTVGKFDLLGNTGVALDFAGQNASAPANALQVGCQFNTSPTTITSGNASPCQLDNAGNLLVDLKTSIPSGSNTMGAVTQANGPWSQNLTQIGGNSVATAANGIAKVGLTDASGNALNSTSNALNVSAAQSGTWTIQPGNTANTTPWLTTDSADMSGTTPGTAPSKTTIVGTIYNSSAPAPTTGQTLPFQSDSAGRLIVSCGSGCGGAGGTSIADEGVFTQGTTSITPIGGVYSTSITNLANNQGGAVQLTLDRMMYTNLGKVGGSAVSTAASGVQKVGIVGNAGSTVDAAVGAGTAPSNMIVGGLIYNSASPSPSNGQSVALQGDSAGNLKVNLASESGTITVQPGNTANTTPWLVTGAGQTFPASQSGSWNIGLNAGSNTIGAVTQSGAPWSVQAAATFPVRDQNLATAISFGQVNVSATQRAGAPWNVQYAPNIGAACPKRLKINQTASADLYTSNALVYICTVSLVVAGQEQVSLVGGTGSTCGTGTYALMGDTTAGASNGMPFAANGGINGWSSTPVLVSNNIGDHICVLKSGSNLLSGVITYADHV